MSLRKTLVQAGIPVSIALSIAICSWPDDGHAALKRVGDSKVFFFATGTPAMKFTGTGSDVTIADDGKNLTITVGLTTIDTGMELRNTHMRDKYLQTAKWPTTKLTVVKSDLKLPAEGAKSKSTTTGTLDLHGVQKKVKVGYEIEKRDGNYVVRGALNLVMTDYGVETPGYVGVSVDPAVGVALTFVAKDL